jgi:multicomponent Na+:H+ antiporter subunit B
VTTDDRGPHAPRGLETPVVAKTVRLVVPFVVTFGLFTMFHGTSSVGGGFQGGVVVAAGVVTVAFTFGLRQTRRWLDESALTAAAVSGVVVFAGVALGSLAFGRSVLELGAFPIPKPVVYTVELVELGIGATVAAAVTAMVVLLGSASNDGGDRR